jgi:GAF domain-containing protein
MITGVSNQRRLAAVADAELTGHLNDQDLDAVVETLRLTTNSPMVVVNIVGVGLQTYAAEVGVGSACTMVPDALSFCAEVVNTGLELTVEDAAMHAIYSKNPLVLSGAVRSYAGVPLVDRDVVLGSVALFDVKARVFTPVALTVLRLQAQLAGSVLALRRAARTDALTGLPNRALCLDRLATAIARLERRPGVVCVMYLDISPFNTFA